MLPRTYRLDAAGRLAVRVDALGGTIAFERDQLGQAIVKNVDGRVTNYISYAYDAVGRRARRATPTGHVTSYAYGADGQAHRLTTGGHRVDFTHDAADRELARVFGDAVTVTSAWDEAGRLSEQHVTAAGRAVNSRAYGYRADGHRPKPGCRVPVDGNRPKAHLPAGRGHRRARWPWQHPGPGHHGLRVVRDQGRYRGEGARRHPTDPHPPITHDDVVEGRIPLKDGYMAPGRQIR
ncbi:hypothetical protein ACFWIB_08045 [Streptomyces sp. NPDC127051]|uniref:hypothetical protein n=1 Tax=Streptomyces sp. NPDC127051 TaxID=3347119 RepID=UPI0036525897